MTAPYYQDDAVTLWHGDCLDVLRGLPDASVDAVVTDPPYGLEFMGKEWDAPWKDSARAASATVVEADGIGGFQDGGGGNAFSRSRVRTDTRRHGGDMLAANAGFQAWCEQWATECLRVLKPGGHLLAFGGSRTSHRLACAIEDAGFEIRDSIVWIYSTGFPKSLNVTNALDRIVPADARCACDPRSTRTAPSSPGGYPSSRGSGDELPLSAAGSDRSSAPSLDDARARTRDGQHSDARGQGRASISPGAETGHPSTGRSAHPGSRSALSPSDESESSDTRTSKSVAPGPEPRRTLDHTPYTSGSAAGSASAYAPHQYMACGDCGKVRVPQGLGTAIKPAHEPVVVARKPLDGTVAANVLRHGTGALNIDGCRIGFASEADERESKDKNRHADFGTAPGGNEVYGDFSMVERTNYNPPGRWPANVILDESQAAHLDATTDGASRFVYVAKAPTTERPREGDTAHPTVKPLDLMRHLVRLVTPPGGTVLEPFAGSGTTAEACVIEGFRCIAIEREADYLPLIVQRLTKPIQPDLFGGVA